MYDVLMSESKQNPTISVIVPVYNVEPYLRCCVDSVLAQTYNDFELILVDDGSSDDSAAILDDYACKDGRVRVVHKENRGQSVARNFGLDLLLGQFVVFVDSDDFIHDAYLKKMMHSMSTSRAKVCLCEWKEFSNGEEQTCACDTEDISLIRKMPGRVAAMYAMGEGTGYGSCGVTASPCSKLYEADLWQNIRFPSGMIFEDQAVIPIVLSKASDVSMISGQMYYYRIHNGSTTHSGFSIKTIDFIRAAEYRAEYFHNRGDARLYEAAMKSIFVHRAWCMVAAKSSHATAMVPDRYKMGMLRAYIVLHRHLDKSAFAYQIAKVYPRLAVYYERALKLKSMLGGRNG